MDAELMADRRRLRRKLSFWRVVSVLVVIAGAVAIGMVATRRGTPLAIGQNHIARISVGGVITGTQRMNDLLRRVGEASSVSGVVISINSPGGTTTGAEELFRNIRQLTAKKPVVAFVDGTAASGGYIAAIAADHIVARETALVGSVGVVLRYPQVSELLSKIGVQVDEVKSSPLKAEPSGFKPTSPETRAVLQEVVDNTYEWFKGLVRERRGLDDAQLAAIATGRIFNGRQGVSLKLVDGVGGERDAIAWLEREKNVRKDLPVRDWQPRSGSRFSFWTFAAVGADLLGLDEVGGQLRSLGLSSGLVPLDGLLAVWHPAAGEK